MSNKFTQKAQNTLNHALNAARDMGHTYIGSEHILLGLLEEKDSIATRFLTSKGASSKELRDAIIDISGIGSKSRVTPSDMTPRAKKIIEASAVESARFGTNYIGTEHILYALLSERDCVAVRLLESEGIPATEIISDLNAYINSSVKQDRQSHRSEIRSLPDEKARIKGSPILSTYGRDLTELAREGRLDPTIGREKETERVIQILSRRTKNNPCLIGEPGVGKTAVVEGLAERIASRRVPDTLINKKIITLNIPSMIAGAKHRGEFEDRMKSVMDEVEKNPDIILFIDEIHIIIGAGAAEGAVDAANIIKPALARGQMQVIGATTISEYRSRIEKDSALERRFQSVTVNEPNEEEALCILRGLRRKYEEHHLLNITDEALEAAIKFSVRYIPDRFLPDKAIDLIDEAASKVRISKDSPSSKLSELKHELALLSEKKETAVLLQDFELAANVRDMERDIKKRIDAEEGIKDDTSPDSRLSVCSSHIADVVTEWTGIPVSRILEDEGHRLLTLEADLKKRIVGQDSAVTAISRAIRRGRIGLKDPQRPIGSFIFIGPSGVGKTELSAALASELFGSEKALIRLDMSEYMEKHSVSRLIGSPPGYVGYEDGGQLTEKIRRRPYSVVLFDEIEKAHPDVFNILLQVLDDGVLTDSQGRRVLFSNTVIIMTSNAGTDLSGTKHILGFSEIGSASDIQRAEQSNMTEALKKAFRPEFLNRVDDIIFFKNLSQSDIEIIAKKMLSEIKLRASAIDVYIDFSPDVAELLAIKGAEGSMGARGIRKAVTSLVENPLSEEILSGRLCAGERIFASVGNGAVIFNTAK